MLFSIIIPTYNSDKTLAACLDSLGNQHFGDFEVLIMDGNSKDRTIAIAGTYQEVFGPRLKIESEPDKGVYDAMNKGILKSSGDWLLFLGSDDQLHDPAVLASVAAFPPLKKYDLVYGNALFLHCRMIYDGRFSLGKILFDRNICHQAIFYRRSLFSKLGLYNLSYSIYADYDYNVRCFQNPQLKKKFINRVISIYNERDGLTGRNTEDISFHMKREEYRSDFKKTWRGKFYPWYRKANLFFNKIIQRLKA